jgi:hypothetical protein
MKRCLAYSLALLLACLGTIAQASIYGTLSNFDIYNETPEDAYGAEIELEDIHSSDVPYTFPANYNQEVKIEYNDGLHFGTRIRYTGYNFTSAGYLPANTAGQSTNGHSCVATAGCEHFGFAVSTQPTTTRFFWLDASGNRIGTMPESVPNPTWNYIAPVNGGAPRVAAVVEVPEPAEIIAQRPDSIWMKVWKVEIDRPVDLAELMSDNPIIPDGAGEVESEWELLEGGLGKQLEAEDDVPDDHYAVIRRYEYYEYTGAYDEEHEPITEFLNMEMLEPPVDELGQFISSNMVAANLAAPLEGDFDQDDDVDGADLLAWQRGFGEGSKLAEGDGNWDDSVDGDDLAIWDDLYPNQENAAVDAVPEPGTCLLSLLCGLSTLLRRSRNRD